MFRTLLLGPFFCLDFRDPGWGESCTCTIVMQMNVRKIHCSPRTDPPSGLGRISQKSQGKIMYAGQGSNAASFKSFKRRADQISDYFRAGQPYKYVSSVANKSRVTYIYKLFELAPAHAYMPLANWNSLCKVTDSKRTDDILLFFTLLTTELPRFIDGAQEMSRHQFILIIR